MTIKEEGPTTYQVSQLNQDEKNHYIKLRKQGVERVDAYAQVKAATRKKAKKKAAKKKTQKKKAVKKKAKAKPEINQPKKKSRGGAAYKKTGEGVGGKRAGAGRKKGSVTKKTREVANKLVDDGEITPLEYMMAVLRETPEKLKAKYDAGELSSKEFIVELQAMQKRKDNAAEKAAPYIHPRLSSIEAKVTDNAHEKWLALMADEK